MNRFLEIWFSNFKFVRRQLGGLWTYYFNNVVGPIWVRRESRNERLNCNGGIIKEEDYRLEELYRSYNNDLSLK